MYELAQFRAALIAKKQNQTYSALSREYGVNQNYLWNIINDPDYEPPARICAKLGIAKYEPARVCPIHGIVETYDCQKQVVKAKREKKPPKQKKRYPRYYAWMFEQTKGW